MSGTCSTRSDVSNAHEVLVRKPRLKETIWRQHVDKILKCLTETLSEVVNRTAVEMSKPPAPELQQQVLHYMCSRRSGSASKRIYTDGFCVGKRSSEFAIGHSKITTISNYASLCFKKSPPPVFGTTPTTSGSLPLCLHMQYKCYRCKSNCCHYNTHNVCACF